ncbi:hypothetical protein HPB50_024041 [Hyalomma asiaticum]|uniref:Uncharacterized protein n=1 Tax=Hyalomma asiaticum TaxID=266040 RepID=A0ACB7SZD2_HYAAI|nr:hypothetical protein HPB50_024041 [Hyalomma asiaticum]
MSTVSAAAVGGLTPKMAFHWLLLLATTATVAAVTPVAPSVNEQVDRVLEPGVLCDFISNNRRCVDSVRQFFMWNSSWWFWPEFYDGEISGLGRGLKRHGDCSYDKGNSGIVRCRIDYSNLQVRYQWRVMVKSRTLDDCDQEENPRDVIELGSVVATVPEGTIRVKLRRDQNSDKFRVRSVRTHEADIGDVDFENETAKWRRRSVDTNSYQFQQMVRQMFGIWVKHYFEEQAFKEAFNKALVAMQS